MRGWCTTKKEGVVQVLQITVRPSRMVIPVGLLVKGWNSSDDPRGRWLVLSWTVATCVVEFVAGPTQGRDVQLGWLYPAPPPVL